MHAGAAEFLPRELARLHAFGYGLEEEWALAPYAIDDATDLLFEKRTTPNGTLWLAADGLRALAWGLHDWAHFHNHGPFEERAWTELQCDASAPHVALDQSRGNSRIRRRRMGTCARSDFENRARAFRRGEKVVRRKFVVAGSDRTNCLKNKPIVNHAPGARKRSANLEAAATKCETPRALSEKSTFR